MRLGLPQCHQSIPHLLSCARHWCFVPVAEVLAVSSQGPIRFLWLWYPSRGIYGKRVCFITSRASLGGYRTKSHRLSPHPSTAGQPSGLPRFLPRGVTGSTWLALGDLVLATGESKRMAASSPKPWVSVCRRWLHTPCPVETPQDTVPFPEGFFCSVPDTPWAGVGQTAQQHAATERWVPRAMLTSCCFEPGSLPT